MVSKAQQCITQTGNTGYPHFHLLQTRGRAGVPSNMETKIPISVGSGMPFTKITIRCCKQPFPKSGCQQNGQNYFNYAKTVLMSLRLTWLHEYDPWTNKTKLIRMEV